MQTDQLALASQIKHDYLLSATVSEDEGMCMWACMERYVHNVYYCSLNHSFLNPS